MAGGERYTPEEDAFLRSCRDYADYIHRAGATRFPERTRDAFARRRWVIERDGLLHDVSPSTDAFALDTDPIPPPRLDGPPESDEDWERLFHSLEDASARRADLSDSTKRVEWRAPVEGPIGIAILSDIHAGASGVLYKRFRADLETIARTDGLYGIVNGDLTENTKPQSKSGSALYSSIFASPREQYEYVRRRLAIARGKWIVITQGNHDAWDYRQAGIDRLPDLCRELGVPYATEAGATVMLTVGVQRYVLVVKHDYAGKSKINKSNSQRRLWEEWPHIMENVNADVVALAHLHEPDRHTTMKKGSPVTLLRSGTFKTSDSWAESAGFKPSYGVPVLIFDPAEKYVESFMDFGRGVQALEDQRRRWKSRAA